MNAAFRIQPEHHIHAAGAAQEEILRPSLLQSQFVS
jgi:hypothetical protein